MSGVCDIVIMTALCHLATDHACHAVSSRSIHQLFFIEEPTAVAEDGVTIVSLDPVFHSSL